jgi:NAD(P)-dependent dehydrogenase (short-subunit alcohol dehydrogenase family)
MARILEGRVALVTGSGGGIGRELAHAFAAHGANVVVNDIGKSKDGDLTAHVVAGEITAAGCRAAASTDSVADWDAANRIVQCAMDTFGRIDCVVNNAGIVCDDFFFNMSPEAWRAVIDVHLNVYFYVARAAAPHFRAQSSGVYLHMTSMSGLAGNVGQANYSAAKMGIVGLSKSIVLDMAKYNVRSNCIAPWAWTPMTASIPETTENWHLIDKDAAHASSKNRPTGGVSGRRCREQRIRPDIRSAGQRNLPDQPKPHYPLCASQRWLDAGIDR